MSTRIMAQCWPLQMRPPAKAVLVSLADMANDDGYCWPSIDKICERTCFGRTAVIEAIAWLEERGAVRADRANGRKTSYWLAPADFRELSDEPEDNQSATRTRPPRGPVRHADPTSPPRGPNQSATRTLISMNRHESNTPLPPDGGADGFDEFFAAYPRQQAEALARRQWAHLAPSEAMRCTILSAVTAQRDSPGWQRESGRYIPLASKWLSGRRWEDRPAQPTLPDWWLSADGVQAMGAQLGRPYSLAALGSAYTDDERQAHWRQYRAAVFAAAGSGPWLDRSS